MLKRTAPQFSIIVPLAGPVSQFEETLASVLRYQNDDVQVVAVHDGSYQDPHGIGEEVDFVIAPTHSNLGGFLGTALRHSNSPIVGMMRPGIQLDDEAWQSSIWESFEDPSVASVSPLIVQESKPSRVLTAGVIAGRGFRRKLVGQGVRVGRKATRLSPLGPTSWAAFYRRSALDSLGTPDPQLDSVYFDLDVALGLQALGLRSVVQTDCVLTTESGEAIASEAIMPHGAAAARANTRFGNGASTLIDSVFELASSPVSPWLLKHVMGKFSARSMKDVDAAFRRRLETRMVEEVREQAAEPSTATYRRAA